MYFWPSIVALSSEHTFLFYSVVAVVILSGLWFLYKDKTNLEKIENVICIYSLAFIPQQATGFWKENNTYK